MSRVAQPRLGRAQVTMLNETGIFPAVSDPDGNKWEQVCFPFAFIRECKWTADDSQQRDCTQIVRICAQISNPVNASAGGVIGYRCGYTPPWPLWLCGITNRFRLVNPL